MGTQRQRRSWLLKSVRSQNRALPGFVSALPHYPSRCLYIPRKYIIFFVFCFGFFLQCNIATRAFGLRFLQLSDLIVIVTLPFLAFCYYRYLKVSSFFLYILPLSVVFIASSAFSSSRESGEFYTVAFTFLYCLFFFFLVYCLLKENILKAFCWGIFYGFIAVVILLFLDPVMHEALASVGLSYPFDEAAVREAAARGERSPLLLRIAKPGGIWPVGNTAGPAFALAAAAAAYLAEEKNKFGIFGLFLIVYCCSFTQTLNRSGLISVLLIAVILYIHMFSMKLLLKSYLVISISILVIAVILPIGLLGGVENAFSKRFVEDTGGADNAAERFSTLLTGMQVMIEHPFGIGVTARAGELRSLGAHAGTPHNGFVSTAYASGLPFAVIAIASVSYVMLRRRKIRFFSYAAIGIICGYMFEELNANPVFMGYVAMVIGYAVLDVEFRLFMWRRVSNKNSLILNRTKRAHLSTEPL